MYELTHPKYETDFEFNKNNPLIAESELYLPLLKCQCCGSTWGGDDIIYLNQDKASKLEKFLKKNNYVGKTLITDEWNNMAYQISDQFGIPLNEIKPTAQIGNSVGLVKGKLQNDIYFPMPGQIWVTLRVKKIIEEFKFTGIGFEAVKMKMKSKTVQTPDKSQLWEMVVKGSIFRRGVRAEDIIVCDCCKRSKFPDKDFLLDLKSWTGHDFCMLDNYKSFVIVSNEVKEVFESELISNCLFIDYKSL